MAEFHNQFVLLTMFPLNTSFRFEIRDVFHLLENFFLLMKGLQFDWQISHFHNHVQNKVRVAAGGPTRFVNIREIG